ncbi:MAG: bifunctional methylenetetrahydrofolate dehydrogenase/methenyltetrahydrofolate cyclohydrolase [Candidatus Dojkabacteria bacterium]|nr:bifunctional methylenetetrahydrofolate dehydrogenase/methenyltetrahydrofolate cyclohydrolase [Candidatus Dojkabacteria bacterium]
MLLDGKKAQKFLTQKSIQGINLQPTLAAIQIGHNLSSKKYLKFKRIFLTKLGFSFNLINLSTKIKEHELIEIINKLNFDESTNGIIVQLPIPDHLNKQRILDRIIPEKDVDCLDSYSIGRFLTDNSKIYPATPKGIIHLLKYYKIELTSKHVCVIGRSNLVGKPLSIALLKENATVTICHSHTNNLEEITKDADIVISAIGKAKFLTSKYFRKGQTVIDVGINFDENGKICGDVDFDNVKDIVENITPVPGGVGPMTIWGLVDNLIELTKLQND